jgi:UDP-2-acetamido-2,6-beta-L-arabino-hexul-4-ose reductase
MHEVRLSRARPSVLLLHHRTGRGQGESLPSQKGRAIDPGAGTAVISLRRLFHTDVVDICMDSTRPVAVDVPTLWAHHISNAGPEDFRSAFWSNEVFDQGDPGTFFEEV